MSFRISNEKKMNLIATTMELFLFLIILPIIVATLYLNNYIDNIISFQFTCISFASLLLLFFMQRSKSWRNLDRPMKIQRINMLIAFMIILTVMAGIVYEVLIEDYWKWIVFFGIGMLILGNYTTAKISEKQSE